MNQYGDLVIKLFYFIKLIFYEFYFKTDSEFKNLLLGDILNASTPIGNTNTNATVSKTTTRTTATLAGGIPASKSFFLILR
jgi:hypothetical protein